MLGWSSLLCRGIAAKQTPLVLGCRSSTPSGLQVFPPLAPQNHFHVPVRGAEQQRGNETGEVEGGGTEVVSGESLSLL